MDSEKWAERLVRSPKTGRDYTSARGPDKDRSQNQAPSPSSQKQDLTDRFQNIDIRIDHLRMSVDKLEGRVKQFDSLDLNERFIKTERRSRQMSVLVIVLAILLGLSIIRDILHETGTDITSLISRIHSSLSLENAETQVAPMDPDKNYPTPTPENDPN